MDNKIRLSPEYACFPLWRVAPDGGLSNAVAHSFGIPEKLANDIEAWGDIFENTYNSEYPPLSGFNSEAEALSFKAKGTELLRQLQQHFGKGVQVELSMRNVTVRQQV